MRSDITQAYNIELFKINTITLWLPFFLSKQNPYLLNNEI